MSILLPPKTHPARELIDMTQLASLGDVQNRMRLPSLQQARLKALKIFDSTVRQVNMLILNSKGELELVGFEPSSEKVLWNFGEL